MPPPSEDFIGSLEPQLSKICTSYSPCRYTPEFEPLEIMNSRYSSTSPNFSSVTKSAVRPCGPFKMVPPGAADPESRVGASSRSNITYAVVNHCDGLLSRPCQPLTSLPLSSGRQPSSIRNG